MRTIMIERVREAAGVLLVALTVLGGVAAMAGQSSRVFGVGGTALGATNSYAVVPAVGGRVAVVKSLLAFSDLTAARITFFTNGARVALAYGVTAGTNLHLASGAGAGVGTNGFAAGDWIVLQAGNIPNQLCTKAQVHAVGTTNVSLKQSVTAVAGDVIYRLGTNQVITGLTNVSQAIMNGFIAVGEEGKPLVVDINGSASCSVGSVGGEYLLP